MYTNIKWTQSQVPVSCITLKFNVWHAPATQGGSFQQHSFESSHISCLTFPKKKKTKKNKLHVQGRVVRELQKKPCSWSEGEAFLIRAPTAEDSGNDGAFDLAPLDNIPPSQRPAPLSPKGQESALPHGAYLLAEFLLIYERNVPVSQGALQISVWHFSNVCFSFLFTVEEFCWNYLK